MKKQPKSHHCFVCGVKNVAGVQVAFYETVNDVGEPEVLARFTGEFHHQGYPERMHGGVVMGVLDETIGRAVNIGAPDETPPMAWGVTADFSMRFQQPVPLGVELTARGRVTRERRRLFEGSGELYLPDGSIAVTAVGKYLKLGLEEIAAIDAEALGWRVYADDELATR